MTKITIIIIIAMIIIMKIKSKNDLDRNSKG